MDNSHNGFDGSGIKINCRQCQIKKIIIVILVSLLIAVSVRAQKIPSRADSLKVNFEQARKANAPLMFVVPGEQWQWDNLLFFLDSPDFVTPDQRKQMALWIRRMMTIVPDSATTKPKR